MTVIPLVKLSTDPALLCVELREYVLDILLSMFIFLSIDMRRAMMEKANEGRIPKNYWPIIFRPIQTAGTAIDSDSAAPAAMWGLSMEFLPKLRARLTR